MGASAAVKDLMQPFSLNCTYVKEAKQHPHKISSVHKQAVQRELRSLVSISTSRLCTNQVKKA